MTATPDKETNMKTPNTRRGLTLVLALAVVLAACGGDDADDSAQSTEDSTATEQATATDAPTDAATDAATEADAAVSTSGMTVAYASDLDPNDVADQIGLQAAGAEVTALTEDSAVAAGLNAGDFQIGNIDVTAAIKAIQADVPLRIVYVAQTTPEFVMVAQGDITSFDQLAGKTVAYHSPGSLTEIVQRELVRQSDPELEDQIEWTVLPESPNRASAMVAGRIDATSLEFLDVTTLQAEGDFTVLGDWGDLEGASGDALSTVWVVSEDYLADNRDAVVALLEQVQAGYDQTYEDKDSWLALATELLPDADADQLSQAYDYYVDIGMYPQSGEPPVTEESWTGLDEFFRQIGEYEQTASPDMVDFELVAEVAGS